MHHIPDLVHHFIAAVVQFPDQVRSQNIEEENTLLLPIERVVTTFVRLELFI